MGILSCVAPGPKFWAVSTREPSGQGGQAGLLPEQSRFADFFPRESFVRGLIHFDRKPSLSTIFVVIVTASGQDKLPVGQLGHSGLIGAPGCNARTDRVLPLHNADPLKVLTVISRDGDRVLAVVVAVQEPGVALSVDGAISNRSSWAGAIEMTARHNAVLRSGLEILARGSFTIGAGMVGLLCQEVTSPAASGPQPVAAFQLGGGF